MSFPTSPFGQQPPTGGSPDPVEPFEAPSSRRPSLDPRTVRSVVAAAASVAVLGAGAVGFLWLSSAPSGESAQALSGARSTPSVSAPDVVRPGGVAFVGGDPFANNGVLTATADDAGVPAGTGTGAGTSGTGSSAGTTGGGAGPVAPTTAGQVPRVPSTSAAAPVTTAPVTTPPVVVPPSTSTSPVSSAPGWVTPQVTFVGGTAATATFDVAGERVEVAAGQLVHPLSVRFEGVLGAPAASAGTGASAGTTASTAVLSAEGDADVGWLVPAGTRLPDAVVGRTSGTVHLYGVLDDKSWLRVDRAPAVLLAAGSPVPGTPLTFLGRSLEQYPRAGAGAWFSDGTVTYFGSFGAGEGDGVAY